MNNIFRLDCKLAADEYLNRIIIYPYEIVVGWSVESELYGRKLIFTITAVVLSPSHPTGHESQPSINHMFHKLNPTTLIILNAQLHAINGQIVGARMDTDKAGAWQIADRPTDRVCPVVLRTISD